MPDALTAGGLLGERYRIVQLMGEGGFGAVYQAADERFQGARVVAIKEMSDANLSPGERDKALEDFRREANLLVQLNHPNLPHVSDFFEEGGKAYLVMEFIEGKTLEQVLEDAPAPLDETQVMRWALQLCAVLQYLHSRPQPIIFRDMKPSNVMVTEDNQLKLIDFGIARVFKASATKDTTLLGSQGYAPLEQYGRGQSDPRSDIYALGATLYHLLTGSVPADAPSRRIDPQVFETPRQLNPRISPATEDIILMAMEQDPNERFQSADAMKRAILEGGTAQAYGGSYTSGTPPKAPLPPQQQTMQQSAPTPVTRVAAPNETTSTVKTTLEQTILPLAVDIGTSIYQAIKERNAEKAAGNATMMNQPSTYAGSTTKPAQFMAPLTAQAPVPVRDSGMTRGLRQVDTLFVSFIKTIDHIVGWISTLLLLLLAARFVFTFFHLSLGEFSAWVTYLSTPLVAPFGNLLVPIYASASTSYMVDVSAIVAFVVFSIGFGLVRGLLKLLARRQR